MEQLTLRDGSKTWDPRVASLVEFDEESRDYPVSTSLAEVGPDRPLISKQWLAPTCLDQGITGGCGAFMMTHLLLNEPGIGDPKKYSANFAIEKLYWPAQENDRFPGGEYPGADPISQGTSILSILKQAKALEEIDGYEWSFDFRTFLEGLAYVGPVGVGTVWTEGMNFPDRFGAVRPTGRVIGRHAYLFYGINIRTRMLSCLNNWGKKWGLAGRFQMSFDTAERLLIARRGEMVFVKKRRR